jgi:hypothetical protein
MSVKRAPNASSFCMSSAGAAVVISVWVIVSLGSRRGC